MNLADLVKERGGTEKDQALCLLHEVPDLAPDALGSMDEDFRNSVRALGDTLPDFLRHSDDDLVRRSKELLSARRPAHVIWMCDLLEIMTNERLRLVVPGDPDKRRAILTERVAAAITLLDRFQDYKTLSLFMDEVRSEVVRVSTLVKQGLLEDENKPQTPDHAPCG